MNRFLVFSIVPETQPNFSQTFCSKLLHPKRKSMYQILFQPVVGFFDMSDSV